MVNQASKSAILIIDDDEQLRRLLRDLLSPEYECTLAASAEEAIQLISSSSFDLVLSDINMGGISGLDLVPILLREMPETVVVMISGQQTIDTAIQAMRVGAFDYIHKPLELVHVEAAVRRAMAHHKLLADKKYYENHLEELVRQRSAEVERLAYFDSLTKLPNRLLFSDRVDQAIKVATREVQRLAVVLFSLNEFRKVEESLGHAVADRLLREVAARAREVMDEESTLARFEGDQFALLMPNIHGAEKVIEKLMQLSHSLSAAFDFDGHQPYITTCMGVSVFPADGHDTSELLKNGGAALNRARNQGESSYQFYQAEMNSRALKRLTMESELRRAIQNCELILYYQPQVELVSRTVIGAEALIRWQHPRLGLVPPSEFIPMAEETGLILSIGEWVCRTASAQAASWHQSGMPHLRMAVNVAPQQFQQENFVESVAQIVSETGIQPSLLELEITEGSLMGSAGHLVSRLSALKERGVRIAIDDFGIGYSSLGYLKRLPIDALKIDRSFVAESTSEPDDAALVMTIITLAHNLRLEVMAEGVETEEQLRFLRLLRCDQGQGFLFGGPVPPDLFLSKVMNIQSPLPIDRSLHL